MIFRRPIKIQTVDDPGAKLMNRLLMWGLVAFVAFTVLSEKRVLDKTIYKWNVVVTNNTTGKTERLEIIENSDLVLALSEADIKKLASTPKNEAGNIPVYTLKLSQVAAKEAPAAKQNLPKEEPPKAKTNATP
jgi:hypothetical protein